MTMTAKKTQTKSQKYHAYVISEILVTQTFQIFHPVYAGQPGHPVTLFRSWNKFYRTESELRFVATVTTGGRVKFVPAV